MKKILFFVLILAATGIAQDASNQRYTLFQGKYISNSSTMYMSDTLRANIDSSQSHTDTCLALFKIDTHTGQTWILKSDNKADYWSSEIDITGGFGWELIGDYKEETKVLYPIKK